MILRTRLRARAAALLAATLTTSFGLVLFACSSTTVGTGPGNGDDDDDDAGGSDSGHDSGTVVVVGDASTDGGTIRKDSGGGGGSDGGGGGDSGPVLSDASCGPTAATGAFTYVPPVSLKGACTSAQIADYLDVCGIPAMGTVADCDDFHSTTANDACLACLETNVDAGAWGAVAYDLGLGEEYVNVGGCFVTVSDAGDALQCAKAAASADLCEVAACETACTGHDVPAGQACIAAADDAGCATDEEAYNTCLDNEDLANDANDQCVGTDYNSSLLLVATALCGGGE